jgi:hypothetical protein
MHEMSMAIQVIDAAPAALPDNTQSPSFKNDSERTDPTCKKEVSI